MNSHSLNASKSRVGPFQAGGMAGAKAWALMGRQQPTHLLCKGPNGKRSRCWLPLGLFLLLLLLFLHSPLNMEKPFLASGPYKPGRGLVWSPGLWFADPWRRGGACGIFWSSQHFREVEGWSGETEAAGEGILQPDLRAPCKLHVSYSSVKLEKSQKCISV